MLRSSSLEPHLISHPSTGDDATKKAVEAIRKNAAEKEDTYQEEIDLTDVARTPESIQAINEALASIDACRMTQFNCYFKCQTGSNEEMNNLRDFCRQLNLPTRTTSECISIIDGKVSLTFGFIINDTNETSVPAEFSDVGPSAKMLVSEILKVDRVIKESDKDVLYAENFDFSWIQPTEANFKALGIALGRMCHDGNISTLEIEINLSGWTSDRIRRFSELFNDLPFPSNTIIEVFQGTGIVDHRQVQLLRGLNHKNIQGVSFSKSHFDSNTLTEVVDCLVVSRIKVMDFRDCHVLELDSNVLLRELPRLCKSGAKHVLVTPLDCEENTKSFTDVDLKLLADLQASCGDAILVFPETVSAEMHEEIINHFNSLSPSDQDLFARLYYRNIMLATSQVSIDEMLKLPIPASKKLAILEELKPLITRTELGTTIFTTLLAGQLQLPSDIAADFIKQCLIDGIWLFKFNQYGISPREQLELSLLACQHIPYYFLIIVMHGDKLTHPDLPIAVQKIFGAFEKAFDRKDSDSDSDLSSNESDTEEQLERIDTYLLPALESVCKVELKQFPFLLKILDKIKATHQRGSEHTYPLLNMISWFAWSCMRLILLQEKGWESKLDTKDIDAMNRVFNELISFTNPMMRYTLTAEFLEFFFELPVRRCFVDLIEGGNSIVVLPAIGVVKMLKQGSSNANDLKKAHQLLECLVSSQYDGHYFRTLVYGFHAIAAEETVAVSNRLNMLIELFEKSADRVEFETTAGVAVDQFMNRFQEACQVSNPRAQEVVLATRGSLTDAQRATLKRERAARIAFVENQVKPFVVLTKNQHVEALFSEASPKTLERFLPAPGNGQDLDKKMTACRRYLQRLIEGLSQKLYNGLEFKQRNSRLILVQGLSELGELKYLQEISSKGAASLLQRIFGISDAKILHYGDTFGSCYNQGALLTYYAKIRVLAGSPEGEQLLRVFRHFILDVLSQKSAEFYERRYQIEPGSHAEHVFLGKHNLLKGWRLGSQENFLTFFNRKKIEIKDFVPDFKGFIIDKIFGHKHINPEHYTAVGRFLNNLDESHVAEAVNAVEDSKAAYEKDKEYSTQRKYIHARIQLLLINLCQEPVDTSLSISQRYRKHLVFLNKIRALLERYFPQAQFRHDVEVLYAATRNNKRIGSSEKSKWKNWTIVDTDNYWHTFMAGTVIDGSCQHVSTHVSTNKCLMAYVVDPKYRMIAILDEEGIPVARAMVRLLPDLEGSTNAIFLEEAYPDSLKPELQEALVEFAIERAQALDVMLVSYQGRPDSQTYEGTWTSLGSPTPWEYVDALSEVQEGSYTIVGGSILYEPNPSLRFTRKVGNVLDALSNHSEGSSKDEVISSTVTAVTPMLLKAKEHPESPHPVNPRRDEESAKRTAPEFG